MPPTAIHRPPNAICLLPQLPPIIDLELRDQMPSHSPMWCLISDIELPVAGLVKGDGDRLAKDIVDMQISPKLHAVSASANPLDAVDGGHLRDDRIEWWWLWGGDGGLALGDEGLQVAGDAL